ncbi:hypothetical protein ACFOYU_23085 [Microvirga sp. GCM10011540]|uniref:hypothetical protein n=1 Tax=Microvirga sp. GCM10011540 TaxID=3317338 RepID=UPI003623B803
MDDYLDQLRRSLEQDLGLVPSDKARARPAAKDGVSLIITKEQRAQLRERGFTEEEIRNMTPAQAHRHLGIAHPDE